MLNSTANFLIFCLISVLYSFDSISALVLRPISELSQFDNPLVYMPNERYPSICYLPPDSAICHFRRRRRQNQNEIVVDPDHSYFFFDAQSGKCRPFYAEDCVGNKNRFSTLQECQLKCSPSKNGQWPKESDAERDLPDLL